MTIASLIRRIVGAEPTVQQAARVLAMRQRDKRRARIHSVARQLRREAGLPPSKALGA